MASQPLAGTHSVNNLEIAYNKQLFNLSASTTRDEYNIFLVALNNLSSEFNLFKLNAAREVEAWQLLGDSWTEDGNSEGDPVVQVDLFALADDAFANRNLWTDLIRRVRSIQAQVVPAPPDILVIGPIPPELEEPEPDPEPIPEPDPIPPPPPPTPPPDDEPELIAVPVPIPPVDDFGFTDLVDPAFWSGMFGDLASIAWDTTTLLPKRINAMWGSLTDWSSSIFDAVTGLPQLIWSDTFGILEAWFRWSTESIGQLFKATIAGAQDLIGDAITNAMNPLGFFFTSDAFKALFDLLAPPLIVALSDSLTMFLEVLEGAGLPLLSPVLSILRPFWDDLDTELAAIVDFGNVTSQWQVAVVAGAIGAIVGTLVSEPIKAALAPVTWDQNIRWRPRLLGQDDLIELHFLHPEKVDDINLGYSRLGLRDERWLELLLSRQELPFLPTLQDWFYRTRPSTATMREILTRYKFSGEDMDRILETWREFPNQQDVVRFGVREVYRPDIVIDFQLDQDFPEDMVPDMTRIGFDRDDVEKYWRAHWELPSISQTFDMHHRTTTDPIPGFSEPVTLSDGTTVHRVVSRERVDELLRVGDVMARWRDPLTRIAFTPFTRVDIRRLYRTGVFDLAQVERAYIDIGYTQENSLIQAEFVQGLEREQTFDQLETILGGQAVDGTIEVVDALEQLKDITVSDRTQFEAERRLTARVTSARLGEITSAFRQAFRFNRIEEVDLRAELSRLRLPELTIDHIVNVEDTRRGLDFLVFETAEVKASGRTIPVRRFREGLIGADQLQRELEALGYEDTDITRFEAFADLERDTNLRLDTLTAYRSGLRTGRLSLLEFRARSATLGVEPELIEVYILQDQLRRKLTDPTPEEQEVRASGRGLVTRRFREGWTRSPGFRMEMTSLGYTEPEIDLYEIQADLEFDLDWKSDILRELGELFVRGEVTADSYLSRLGDLGMDPDRATTHLARLTASLRPRLRIEGPIPVLPRYQTATGRLEVRLAIEEFRDQIISEPTFAARLAALEMPAELVGATVDLEAFRLDQRLRPEDLEPIPFFDTDEGKIRTRTLTTAFRNRLINGDQLLAGLLELSMPEPEAEALTEFEITRLARGQVGVEDEPVPFFISDEGSIRMRTAREAFRNDLIDSEEYRRQLLELEVPENVADALVTFEVTRKAPSSEPTPEE